MHARAKTNNINPTNNKRQTTEDDKSSADLRPEEAPQLGQQGGAGGLVLPLLLLLVPREVYQVHQQERVHSGA